MIEGSVSLGMFFAPHLFDKEPVSPESINYRLGLPRIEYAKALYDWHLEISKINRYDPGLAERQIMDLLLQSPHETGMISRKLVGSSTIRQVSDLLEEMHNAGKICCNPAGSRKIWFIRQSRSIIIPTSEPPPSGQIGQLPPSESQIDHGRLPPSESQTPLR